MKLEDLLAMEGGTGLAEQLRSEGRASVAGSPATVAELKAEFGSDTDFILGAVEKSMSMSQAKAARAGVLALKLDAATKAHAEETGKLKAELDAANTKLASLTRAGVKPGVEPVAHIANAGDAAGAGGDGGSFVDKVNAIKAEKKCSESEAILLASKQFPALHAAYARGTGGRKV